MSILHVLPKTWLIPRINQAFVRINSTSAFVRGNSILLGSRGNELYNVRFQSTDTGKVKPSSTAQTTPTPSSELDLTFNDSVQAYRSKSNWQIFRAIIVFKLCSIQFLVNNSEKLLKIGQKVLGKMLFEKIMRLTFYGHFVAGKDKEEIRPVIQRLCEFGVKSILDYSSEEDVPEESPQKESKATKPANPSSSTKTDVKSTETFLKKYSDDDFSNRRKSAIARTFFYMSEAQCEKNMEIFLQSIEGVSEATQGTGFAAIKITALGRPQLLLQLSQAIAKIHRYVGAFTGKRGRVSDQGVKLEDLKLRLDKEKVLSDPGVKAWLDAMTYDSSGILHVIPWSLIIEAQKELNDSLRVFDLETGKLVNLLPPLSPQEEEMFKNMMKRLHTIFHFARVLDVRVMVDAEQTYLQE